MPIGTFVIKPPVIGHGVERHWKVVRVCARACGSQPINTSCRHSTWPIRSRQRPPYFSLLRCTRTHFLVCFLSRSPFYISVLVTENTHYLSNLRLSFLYLWAKLNLEETRGYCWRFEFLGLWCSNPQHFQWNYWYARVAPCWICMPYFEVNAD